jgi:putative flippase GtrA
MSSLLAMLVKYGTVGIAASMLHIASALVFYTAAGMPAALANAMAFLLSFAISFMGNYRWTFASTEAKSATLSRFFLLSVACFLLNQTLVVLAMTLIRLPFGVSVTLATLAASVAGFLGSHRWVFSAR